MIDALKDYYREKRIRRILSFYHEIQPYVSPMPGSAHRKIRFISRDAWVQFILTLFLILSLGRIMNYFIAAFLAVEISDYIMIRGTKFFDAIFDYILPLGFLLLVAAGYIGLKHYDLGAKWKEFHKQKNRELHSIPVKNIAASGVGDNWSIEEFSAGNAKPLSLEEARLACQKRAFKLYEGETNFMPPLVLNKSAHFWFQEKNGALGAQLGPGEVKSPVAAFVKVHTEPMHLTLCVKP